MAVTVLNTNVAEMNEATEKKINLATVDTVDGTEVFTITPARADYKNVMEVKNGGATALAVKVAVGDLWAGVEDLVLSVPANKTIVVELEEGKYGQNDGTILVTLTPSTGKKLVTDHSASVSFIGTL